MMYAVNMYSSIYLAVSVVVSGELWTVTNFIQQHPEVLLNITVFSVSSAIGQVSLHLHWVGVIVPIEVLLEQNSL